MIAVALTACAGVALDALFGEPKRWHPLVGFGRLADAIEGRLNRPNDAGQDTCKNVGEAVSARKKQAKKRSLRAVNEHSEPVFNAAMTTQVVFGGALKGVLGWCLAVLPLTLLAWTLSRLPYLGWLIDALLLYLAIGLRSLDEHAQPVADALARGDLDEARRRVGYIVSREPSTLDENGVALAATESVLENGSDAVFAALFWFAVAGASGVVLYRLSNTLDAMWGYRNARFERFGWAAARLDDVLNYLPARLVALTYALLGETRRALRCWRLQGPQWSSPNAGPVMAAGAGALGVLLGGPSIYHGEMRYRAPLGEGAVARGEDIRRAMRLVRRGVLAWLALLIIGSLLNA